MSGRFKFPFYLDGDKLDVCVLLAKMKKEELITAIKKQTLKNISCFKRIDKSIKRGKKKLRLI